MPTNQFFNFYNSKQEQNLVEDLINESLSIYSFEAFYVPKDSGISIDLLYGDTPLKSFTNAYPIHLYLSNAIDQGMNNDFFTKFGLEIKNNLRVILSKRVFDRMVVSDILSKTPAGIPKVVIKDNTITRPNEGDLIYIPWLSGTGELYEIKYTNDSTDFFILGRKHPYYWELELELFKYSHEEIETGIPEINEVSDDHSYSILYEMSLPAGVTPKSYYIGETVVQNFIPYFDVNGKPIIVYYISNTQLRIITSITGTPPTTVTLPSTEPLPIYLKTGERVPLSMLSHATAIVREWKLDTKTLRISNITGDFTNDSYIIGTESNAIYQVKRYNPIDMPTFKDSNDNFNIQEESDNYIDDSISNPFGIL